MATEKDPPSLAMVIIYFDNILVRKLILFLVTCGLFLLLLGLGLILLYSCHQDQHTIVRPLIVIGEQLLTSF